MATPKKGPADWVPRFLARLASSGSVAAAAAVARVSRQEAYKRRGRDPAFAAAWADALGEAVERLADEARRRAVEGVKRPVYQGGKRVGTVTVYSDTLLIVLLKAHGGPAYRHTDRVTVGGEPPRPTTPAPGGSVFDRIDRLAEQIDAAAVRAFVADLGPPPAALTG